MFEHCNFYIFIYFIIFNLNYLFKNHILRFHHDILINILNRSNVILNA